MQTVNSADGTRIAYDQYGEGPAVILVGGALAYRKFKKFEQIAQELAARRLTVINYDRRGRGDSGGAGPASVEREVEDLAALIESVGGSASLWGWSSGGALAMRAAGAAIGVEKLSVYEPPFKTDPEAKYPADDYGARLHEIVAGGDRKAAAKHFMRNGVGMPGIAVAVMTKLPMFKSFAANGLTLTFDYEALGDHNMHGRPLRAEEWENITCPTQVVYGSKTYPQLKHAAHAVAELLPNATLHELPGENHGVSAKAIAPLLAEFVNDSVHAAA